MGSFGYGGEILMKPVENVDEDEYERYPFSIPKVVFEGFWEQYFPPKDIFSCGEDSIIVVRDSTTIKYTTTLFTELLVKDSDGNTAWIDSTAVPFDGSFKYADIVDQRAAKEFTIEECDVRKNEKKKYKVTLVETTPLNDSDIKALSKYIPEFEIDGNRLAEYNGNSPNVVLPDTVTEINPFAFEGCDFIKSVTLSSSVTDISCFPLEAVFAPCHNLEELIVAENNNKYYSQDNCIIERESKTLIVGCKNSVIPGNITSIGEGAFCDCIKLENITIPKSVTNIGLGAFCYCCKLRSITMPNSITNIDDGAFCGCGNLTNITFQGTKEQWNAIAKFDTWDKDTGNYIIHCTDGDIAKDGTEIE